MNDLILRGATILTMDDADTVLSGDVHIRDGRIVAVGDVPRVIGAVEEHLGGDYLLPGFVQAHIHLCQVLFRHEAEDLPLLRWLHERIWPMEGAHDPETLATSARLGIHELLLGGTTCALDMGTVHHGEALAETLAASGIRAAFGKAMMDAGDDVPPSLRETTADSLDTSVRLARAWHGFDNDRLRYALAPRFVLSCTPDLQREVGRLSRAHGWLVHTHSSEHAEEVRVVEATFGQRNIHVLDALGLCSDRSVFAHGVHLDDHERRVLASTGTAICHCPSANFRLGSGMADLRALLDAGVRVAIGADGAPCNNRLDAFVEARTAAMIPALLHGPGVVPARRILRLATRGGAEALGWGDRIGQVTPGRDADLLRIRRDDPRLGLGSDPFTEIVWAAGRDHVRDVWVRGVRLVRDGRHEREDPAALRASGTAALRRILDRIDRA